MVIFRETFHQTLAAANVNLNEFMSGVGYGWIAPILVRLQNADGELTPSAEESSWLASLHEVGRTLGPLFSAIFLDRIGRKYSIIVCSFLFFFTWLLMIFTRSILFIFVLRIVFGFAIGINDVSSSIYLAENCSPSIRGIIGSFIPLCFYAGVFVEYIIATYLSYTTVAIVNAIFGFFVILSIFLLKETPYFLVMKGHHEAAENNFMWLQGNCISKSDINMEMDKIKQNIQTEKLKKSSMVKLFTSPENYKTISTVFIINLTTIMTGYSGINSYASTILRSSSILTANEYTILLGVIQFLAACISPFIVERFNRRTLLMISFLAMSLSQMNTFCFSRLDFISQSIYFPWMIFVSLTMYSIIFAMVYPIVFIIRGELLPISVKAVGGSLAIVVNSFACFVTARLFPVISQQYGLEYNFLIYSIAGIIGLVHVYFTLPETRGKSLIDIQRSLKEA